VPFISSKGCAHFMKNHRWERRKWMVVSFVVNFSFFNGEIDVIDVKAEKY
jgi:hypothetical protein